MDVYRIAAERKGGGAIDNKLISPDTNHSLAERTQRNDWIGDDRLIPPTSNYPDRYPTLLYTAPKLSFTKT
jgi:hypothetical protein